MPTPKHITPSRFKDVMTKSRSKSAVWSKTSLSYADDLVLDHLGITQPEVTAPSLEWGIDLEPVAREYYEFETFAKVELPPKAIHLPGHLPVCGMPDGLVGDDGMIEIKCPYNVKNMLVVRSDFQTYFKTYEWQVQGYLWITGRKWCDFVVFDPRWPEDLRLSVTRIDRDDKMIAELAGRVELFAQLVEDRVKALRP